MAEDIIQFYMPTRVHYQSDTLNALPKVISNWGKRVVLVCARNEIPELSLIHEIRSTLEAEMGTVLLYDDVEAHPDSDDLDSAAYYVRQTDSDVVVGIGGAESLNMAKALAMMITNDGFCSEFLSGQKEPQKPSLPCITIPLYPIYGTEVVPTIALIDAEEGNKKIFSHEELFPAVTIIDPKLSLNLDNDITKATGVAIVSAGVETLLSKVSNDITNTMALRAIEMVFRSLPRLLKEKKTVALRNNMSMASLLVGMAYANSSLGTCHALSMAINSLTGYAEDLLMGIMLPHVMEYNLTASPAKYVQLARIVDKTEVKDITVIEAAIKAVEGVRKLYSEVNFPSRLSELDLQKGDFQIFAEQAAQYNFLKNTPRPLNRDEIETILIAAY